MVFIHPSVPAKGVIILVILFCLHRISCANCYSEVSLLAKMIKVQNIWRGLNGDPRRWFGTKEVYTFLSTNICDSPLNGYGAIEFRNCY
uniref:Subtilisin-like protease SBT5.3 n=1 Tax=Rhizophora mucronata TaxID=61149 RepID=A0A2P2NGM1_RHIMU